MSKEWNAGEYHRLSDPQTSWALRVLARLPLAGDETVVDLGCGSGRLTAEIVARLPRGHAIGVDRSTRMLRAAAAHLGARASLLQADALALPFRESVDAIFSTATFHWVLDHPRLFAGLNQALKPGGRLVAQCGGKGNLANFLNIARDVLTRPMFAAYAFPDPWEYADAATTAARLAAAGFVDVETSQEPADTPFSTVDEMRAFVATCILRLHLDRMSAAIGEGFLDAVMARTPLVLDYRRLNLAGRKILTRNRA